MRRRFRPVRWCFLGLGIAASIAVALYVPPSRRGMALEIKAHVDRGEAPAQVFFTPRGMPFHQSRSVGFDLGTDPDSARTVRVPMKNPPGWRLRFDPTDRPGQIVTLTQMRAVVHRGPFVEVYTPDFREFHGLVDLRPMTREAEVFRFETTGIDAQMVVGCASMTRHRFLHSKVAFALLALLGSFVLVLEWPRRMTDAGAGRLLIYVGGLSLFAWQACYYASKLPLSDPPDEDAHLEYAVYLEETGEWIPNHRLRTRYHVTGESRSAGSYLAHPPFYYHALRPFLPADPKLAFLHFRNARFANLACVLGALALFYWALYKQRLPTVFAVYLTGAVLAVPTLPYLAGVVNNDNGGILGGSIAFYGALAVLGRPARNSGFLWLGLGTAIAMLAKATAGLHVGAFAALTVLWRLWRERSWRPLRSPAFWAMVLLCAVPAVYYASMRLQYGTFIPRGPQLRHGRGTVPVLPVLTYMRLFLMRLSDSWTGLLCRRYVYKETWLQALPLLAPIATALLGLFYPRSPTKKLPRWAPCIVVLRFAGIATLLLGIAYAAQLRTWHVWGGMLGGQQARYLFSLVGAVLGLSFVPFLPWRRHPLCLLILALLLLGFAFAGFHYYVMATT